MIHDAKEDHTIAEHHPKISLGERFKIAREAKQWSIEEVAGRLRMTKQRVSALENDLYHEIQAETYAKGYLRNYAKLLGLPVDDIIAEFDRQDFTSKIKRQTPQLLEFKQIRASDRSMKYATYAISITLVLMVGLWWKNQHYTSAVPVAQTTIELPAKLTLQNSDVIKPLAVTPAPEISAEPKEDSEEAAADEEQQQAALMHEESRHLSQLSPIPSELLR